MVSDGARGRGRARASWNGNGSGFSWLLEKNVPLRQMSVFGLAPGSVKPRNRSTRLAHFIDPREERNEPADERTAGKTTRATMALMDTVGKVAGKVAKFADDYKVRVVTLAMARATPRGAAPRAIDHSRRRNPTRSQTLTPSPPSRPPVSTQDYFHYGLIPAIIVIGMTTTPRPSLSQLLTPV
jgi:hypothetical protein